MGLGSKIASGVIIGVTATITSAVVSAGIGALKKGVGLIGSACKFGAESVGKVAKGGCSITKSAISKLNECVQNGKEKNNTNFTDLKNECDKTLSVRIERSDKINGNVVTFGGKNDQQISV